MFEDIIIYPKREPASSRSLPDICNGLVFFLNIIKLNIVQNHTK